VLGQLMVGCSLGLSQQGRSLGASVVLHVANMRRARDLGAVDFDTLGVPTAGIAHYKRGLGAEFRQRGYAQWEPSWLPSRRYLRFISARLPARRAAAPKSA